MAQRASRVSTAEPILWHHPSNVDSPLGGSNAVLLEFSFDRRPLYLEDTLFRLQFARYCPVLAHPERYGFIRRHAEGVGSKRVVRVPKVAERDIWVQGATPRGNGHRMYPEVPGQWYRQSSVPRQTDVVIERGSAFSCTDECHAACGPQRNANRGEVTPRLMTKG